MTQASEKPPLFALVVLTATSVLSLNLFLPSLAGMAEDFGVSYARMSLAVSGYFALTAVLYLVVGPLSDRIGRRPVMLAGFAIFTAASLLCALAPTATIFLIGRVLQCAVLVGGALSSVVVRDTHPPQDSARMLGQIGAAMALAPMLGPLLGGAIDAAFGWRANFALYTMLGVLCFALVHRTLGETNANLGRPMAAQIKGYPGLLRSRRFWANAVCMAFSASVFYIFLSGAPLVATEGFAMSPALLGVAMASTPAGFMLGNLLTSRLAHRLSLGTMMLAGRVVTVAGLVLAVIAAQGAPSPVLYFGLMISVGIGNGLTFPAGMTGVMSARPELSGSASGLSGALMLGTGAALTAVAGAVLTPANAMTTLPALMLAAATAALVAAWAAHLEDRPKAA